MKKLFMPIVAGVALLTASCGGNEEEAGQMIDDLTAAMDSVVEDMVEAPAYEVTEKMVEAQPAYTITDSATLDMMSDKFGEMFGALYAYTGSNNIEPTGKPFAIWTNWNPEGYSTFSCGVPVAETGEGSDNVVATQLEAGNTITTTHMGSYETSEAAYNAITDYVKESDKWTIIGAPWEVYVVGPSDEADTTKWHTEIYFPVGVLEEMAAATDSVQ